MNGLDGTTGIALVNHAENKDAIGEASVLAKRAILVYPNMRAWGGQKIDRKNTRELMERNNTRGDDSTRVVQQLLKPMVKACKKPIGAIRTRSSELTLPYDVDGWWILPTAMYFDYVREMRTLVEQAYATIEAELEKYDYYLMEERKRKNGLFVAEMYPTKQEIRDEYELNFYFKPVPDAGSWIVDVEREEMDKLRSSVATHELENIYAGMRKQWDRLHDVVQHMFKSLSVFGEEIDGSNKTRTFRDSMVGNIQDLCEILPKLNITGDADLARYVDDVRAKLAQYDPEDLRKDEQARKQALRDSQEILDAMSAYMS